MKEISSTTNPLVKETVKLHQKKYRDKYILIEGKKAFEEAVSSHLEIKYVLTSIKSDFKNFETYYANEAVMKKVSTTESFETIVAVAKKPVYKIEEFKKMKKIALLDGIKDAGNLGTIIRASCALGVEGILLFNNTTDEFSPKTIRSAAGNSFKIPILKTDMDNLKAFKKTHKFLATVCHSDNFFKKKKYDSNIIVMFGSEANGLSDELIKLSDEKLTLKLAQNVESLNLALSFGIIMYQLQ